VAEEQHGPEVPAGLELAWGLRERPAKGPKRGLSLAQVVAAAVRVADAEGLLAVSMSRVAADLGTSTMALYRYVAGKQQLLDLMVDAAYAPPPEDLPLDGWRPELGRWARAQHRLQAAHPWIVRVPIGGPPIMPNMVAWFEVGLRALRGLALSEADRISIILLVSGYVRSESLLTADLHAAMAERGEETMNVMLNYEGLLLTLTDAQRFPYLHAAVRAGAFGPGEDPPDREFEFGLARILDGIAAHLEREG
jgi:AcrR family transcriptional regulator